MNSLLREYASKINIDISDEVAEKFKKYKDILLVWNEKMNLTAITDENEIVIKHFIDSLTIEKYIPQNAKLIDVGTGAGFPGIPLKIARDDLEIVLLDSLQKRVNFLNEVINECELKNISAVHGRAEDFGQDKKYRENFDIVTARAVANLATLTELCIPFIKVGGIFVCMKGDASEEINTFKLVGNDAVRTIIVYKKEKSTPSKYPRKAGVPSKNPII